MRQRRRNARGEGALLRQELMRAALRLLDRAPATELSLRSVAREAGVAPPSVYRHFADAKTLLTEIVQECWRQLGEAMAATAAGVPPEGPLEALKAEMAAYVRFAMERPSHYQLLFALPADAEALADAPALVRPAYRAVLARIEQLAAQGVALPVRDQPSAALLVISIAHGRIAVAHLAPSRPANLAPGVEAFVLEAIEGVFHR